MSERIRLSRETESELEPVTSELVPRPEILRDEALEARVAQAVEAVEFQPTPEVYQTIRSFYVVPLRRRVFSFLPEESDGREYPYIDRNNTPNEYLRVA